eukprot:CAMPEP_0171801234 /NCGR_PEP_ID=MMETSP0991-20121206/72144_1 /TAXON_ID=483369 /ORGANISM="non described non described, Strain CCMP2098" /LENGTH=1019 /DNA_ID=CAMNT_0012412877 /DNA_START=73 /DNA_END=3132 /DNA_ORIENTATION=-
MAESIEERIQKLKEHVPDDKTEQDIRDLIESSGDDEVAIQGKIAEWWEASANAEEEEEEAPPPPPPPAPEPEAPQEEAAPQPPPKPKSDKPKPPKSSSSKPGSGSGGGAGGSGGRDKEMMDFRHLMVKGLELKKAKDGASEKCVIYMDVTCRTFFCAKQKNSSSAKAYRVEEITEASAGSDEKIITIVHKEGDLDLEVSSPKIRDYLVRMLNKLFTLENSRAAEGSPEGGEAPSKESKSSSSRSKDKASKKESSSKEGGGGSGGGRTRPGRIQVSQVKLLAEHCYSMTDDAIEEMVSAKIPTHSRWESYQEFKDKINRRDELIRSLQDGLGTINSERLRFQRACEDIELHHQDELQELKQHLAMALTSFQELQRASEQRESEMRENLKGANDRSSKFETEKETMLASMNDQKVNGAASVIEVTKLKGAIATMNGDLDKKTAEYEDARKRFQQVKEALTVERNLRARAEIKEDQMKQEINATEGQMHAMRGKFQGDAEVSTKAVDDNTAAMQEKIDGLESSEASNTSELETTNKELGTLQGDLGNSKKSLKSASGKASELAGLATNAGEVDGVKLQIERLEKEMADFQGASKEETERLQKLSKEQEERILTTDNERRKMHNVIQELRGNIRVYIRVRPFLKSDKGVDLTGKLDPAVLVKQDGVSAEIRRLEEGSIVETHAYSFDKSFPCATTQDDIFAEVSEFVQSALDGYNVCLFSYGQTGSGKTHTMQGYGKGSEQGIIPRSIEKIGVYRELMREKGWEYKMDVTFIEIYNEQVFDLLRLPGSAKLDLPIKLDAKGKTYVHDVNKMRIDPTDLQSIDDLMETAAMHRATASTEMNAVSSRSHSIFSLYLTGVNSELGANVSGTLHLCDLAGSERVARSGAEGARLKEAININKSLSSLTDVFKGLAEKQGHIPFRNSKLTYFLQPALSGDGKTMMFVNLSPTNESYFESLCSLRFAQGVNKIELGRAARNVTEEPMEASGSDTEGAAEADPKAKKSDRAQSKSPTPVSKLKGGAKKKK